MSSSARVRAAAGSGGGGAVSVEEVFSLSPQDEVKATTTERTTGRKSFDHMPLGSLYISATATFSGIGPLSEPPKRRLRTVRLLDQHSERIDCLPQLRQRHPRAPRSFLSHLTRSPLSVLGFEVADQESDGQSILEVERREFGELRSDCSQVASVEGSAEKAVRTTPDRHEHMFA